MPDYLKEIYMMDYPYAEKHETPPSADESHDYTHHDSDPRTNHATPQRNAVKLTVGDLARQDLHLDLVKPHY